jgi:hypothetical protein
MKKKVIISRVKDIFGTCGLETLFFDISISIRIADGTWVLKKDELGTCSTPYFVILNIIS